MPNVLEILSTYTLGTPDFGHSDLWHQNFAFAFHLDSALKAGYFPFWVKDIGMGFPMLADGEMGMFFLPNIIAFRFFNPILAFNLVYIVAIATLVSGSFLYTRAIKLSKIASLFFAIVFSFSGLIITQLRSTHITQAISFLPWEFFLIERFVQTRQKRWLIGFSLILSQQIFANYQQIVLISLIGLAIYLSFRLRQEHYVRGVVSITISLAAAAVISLPQLIPTAKMVQLSFRSRGTDIREIARFPYHPKNLLAFINPYIWGDPRSGTYPPFSANWGIFWESTGYLGIIPLLLIGLSFKNKRYFLFRHAYGAMAIIALILLLGKFTPLFFLFQLPPLSLFRVPARFLLLLVWSLAVLSAVGLDRIKHRLLTTVILIGTILDLGYFATTYHALVNAKEWLSPPTSVNILQKDRTWYRVYSVIPYADWNRFFLHGWKDMKPYEQFRNALDPNQNLFWDISSEDSYTGLTTRRFDIWQEIVNNGIKFNSTLDKYFISSPSAKLLSLAGVKYVVAPRTLGDDSKDPSLSLVTSIAGQPNFYLYQNLSAWPHAYTTRNFAVAKSISELVSRLADPDNHSVILEKDPEIISDTNNIEEASVTKNTDLSVEITTKTDRESLLILTDSYYPNWQAHIDGRPAEIMPANLNQRAVKIPSGTHKVVFTFDPFSL